MNIISLAALLVESRLAHRYAVRRAAPGLDFAEFGRKLGWKLLGGLHLDGLSYLVTPVNSVRYFEFPFAWNRLPRRVENCLDLSSPRLFSLYAAARYPDAKVRMLNPDDNDITVTRKAVAALRLANVETTMAGIEAVSGSLERYDCIWSLSVIEHINGSIDDSQAVKILYDALLPGGWLIVTVPVGRSFRDERRRENTYGTQRADEAGSYFFQRVYDLDGIRSRLLDPIGAPEADLEWFGEATAGRFASYEQRWREQGLSATASDAREICDGYRRYDSWHEMPGDGVCGIAVQRSGP